MDDMDEVKRFSEMVTLELKEMKKLGMRVPKKAIEMAQDLEVMKEYDNMRTSECADLLIDLADIK
jgi:hypothetical protein